MNMLEYLPVIQTSLDQLAIQVSTSGWMAANSSQVNYTGGNEIKIPTLLTSGLGDYNRQNGSYPKGNIKLDWQTHKIKMDRGAEFYFDRHDVDETNFIVTATSTATTLTRDHIIPEMDAYRYSTIATTVIDNGGAKTETITAANVIPLFLTAIREMQDKTGLDTTGLVATMPYGIYSLLEQADKVTKTISPALFTQGALQFQVNSINGIPIIPVSSARMKTAYEFATGELDFGFTPVLDSKDINWIICPRTAPIAFSKTENFKVFDPATNQDGDGWKVQYRQYHDLWIPNNKRNQFIVSIKG